MPLPAIIASIGVAIVIMLAHLIKYIILAVLIYIAVKKARENS